MKDRNSVFVAWRSEETKSWHVIGLLTEDSGSYVFRYTKGVNSSNSFTPFSGMPDLNKVYKSETLFPIFKNRLLSRRRPEYPTFIKWMGLDEDAGVIDILGRSEGIRETDQLQMFQRVEFNKDGAFEHIFFAHGIGHLAKEALERVSELTKGERLYMSLDCQNTFDKEAVIIRAENPAQIVGYCPRYLAGDISLLLKNDKDCIKVYVESTSQDAPSNYQLMCKLVGKFNQGQISNFMNQQEFQPIGKNASERLAC